MILELYDQATREVAGGEMARYLRRNPLPNEAFIYSRIGEQGRRHGAGARSRPATPTFAINAAACSTGSRPESGSRFLVR